MYCYWRGFIARKTGQKRYWLTCTNFAKWQMWLFDFRKFKTVQFILATPSGGRHWENLHGASCGPNPTFGKVVGNEDVIGAMARLATTSGCLPSLSLSLNWEALASALPWTSGAGTTKLPMNTASSPSILMTSAFENRFCVVRLYRSSRDRDLVPVFFSIGFSLCSCVWLKVSHSWRLNYGPNHSSSTS